jgi:hypothetical protein
VFFGGVFKVLIPDNAPAIVADADAVNPRFTAGWLDYAQHCGFVTDAARVRSPKDKGLSSHCTSWAGSGSYCFGRFLLPGGRPVALRGVMAGIW